MQQPTRTVDQLGPHRLLLQRALRSTGMHVKCTSRGWACCRGGLATLPWRTPPFCMPACVTHWALECWLCASWVDCPSVSAFGWVGGVQDVLLRGTAAQPSYNQQGMHGSGEHHRAGPCAGRGCAHSACALSEGVPPRATWARPPCSWPSHQTCHAVGQGGVGRAPAHCRLLRDALQLTGGAAVPTAPRRRGSADCTARLIDVRDSCTNIVHHIH